MQLLKLNRTTAIEPEVPAAKEEAAAEPVAAQEAAPAEDAPPPPPKATKEDVKHLHANTLKTKAMACLYNVLAAVRLLVLVRDGLLTQRVRLLGRIRNYSIKSINVTGIK